MQIPFDIEFPAGWNVSFDNRNGTAAQGASPARYDGDVGAIAMVRVFDQSRGADVFRIAEALIAEMSKHFKNFRLLNNSRVQIRAVEARRLEYLSNCPGSAQLFKHIDHVLLVGTRGYLIMTGAPLSEFSKFEKELNSIIQSFELKNVNMENLVFS